MTVTELIRRLNEIADHGIVNFRETDVLREAAERLRRLDSMLTHADATIKALNQDVEDLEERIAIMAENEPGGDPEWPPIDREG